MKIHVGTSHFSSKVDSATTIPAVKEGPTPDGRYSIILVDGGGVQLHEARGDTRWHCLYGLLKFGFDVEWASGETPEPRPEKSKPVNSSLSKQVIETAKPN